MNRIFQAQQLFGALVTSVGNVPPEEFDRRMAELGVTLAEINRTEVELAAAKKQWLRVHGRRWLTTLLNGRDSIDPTWFDNWMTERSLTPADIFHTPESIAAAKRAWAIIQGKKQFRLLAEKSPAASPAWFSHWRRQYDITLEDIGQTDATLAAAESAWQ